MDIILKQKETKYCGYVESRCNFWELEEFELELVSYLDNSGAILKISAYAIAVYEPDWSSQKIREVWIYYPRNDFDGFVDYLRRHKKIFIAAGKEGFVNKLNELPKVLIDTNAWKLK